MNFTEYVELWTQGDAATDFFRKQVLLVLGRRNVAKDNFIQFLARNDSDLQMRDASSSFKPSLAPVIVHTVSSNVTIYDFDSFDESSSSVGLPLGISNTYILQKVINSTDELKIMILINFSSTKHGIDKHHFTAQIRKITSWIKNIDNYTNSIGLIVTNVANTAENQVLVDLDQILNHVETHLEQLRKENSQNIPMLKLLNILLRKTKDTAYERIGIFRQPNNQPTSNQVELIQKEWQKMKTLSSDIQFSPSHVNDFNFHPETASDNSNQNFMTGVINELDERIAEKIDAVFQKLQQEFDKDMNNNYAEARRRLSKMDSVQDLKLTEPLINQRDFILSLESQLNKLDIHVSQSFLDDTLRLIDYLQFTSSVDSKTKLEWPKAMDKIINYIKSFHDWNNFLREMDFVTSSYDVQKNSEKLYNTFINKPITELNDGRLQQFVKDYYHNSRLSTYYNEVKNQKFSSLKILSLESIFKLNLKPGIVVENNNSTGETSVFGKYIFLSNVINKFPNQKLLSINAASKIFIDTNITKSYYNNLQMLSIISPVWELPQTQNVQIILDGVKGYTSIIPAGKNGDHGRVGYPGGSAGHFLGVAELLIHNGRSLLISTNGGRGGSGTNGGAGSDGQAGNSAATKNCERTGDFDSFQREDLGGVLYKDYCVYGRRGKDGSPGGNGGVGAKGGFAGNLTLIGFERETNIKISHFDGQKGEDGKGGPGGNAGKNGKSYKITKKTFWWAQPQCNQASEDYCGAKSPIEKAVNGAQGRDAYVTDGLQDPVKIEHPHWSSLISTYRKYLLKEVPRMLNEKQLSFLQKLNKNLAVINLDLATSLADEFFYIEAQYQQTKNLIWFSYFEQLLYRTEHYLTTKYPENDDEIAKMVQEAILAKFISIKDQRSRSFIVDLKKYIEIGSDRIKDFDPKSIASYMGNELWSHESEIKNLVEERDENNRSSMDNNADEIADLISTTQENMLSIFNESYEQFEHKMAVLRTLITMKDTFYWLRLLKENGQQVLKTTLPVNKFFFSETEIPDTVVIKSGMLQLTQNKLDNWRNRFEPVLKYSVDKSTAFSALNSQLKQKYNSLLETKAENFHENSKNIGEFVRKIDLATTDMKAEEQNFIKKLKTMWFLCESQFENCHLLENHRNVIHALQTVNKELTYSKVQRLSDSIIDIHESFLSGVLKHPEYMVLDKLNLTNSLLQAQLLYQRIKESFKLPLPELVEHGLVALEADTKRIESYYADVAYYQEIKRFKTIFHNRQSLEPIMNDLGNSISLSILQYTYKNEILNPFYQLDFPFAYEDAKDVEITASNYHTFKIKASTAIEQITSKIKRGPLIDRIARIKEVDLMYNRQVQELYRWKGEENEKTIENLLQGKPVSLKADILKYDRHEQAIKIRNVNFELQTKNQTLQKDLDKDLQLFWVTLKHSGVSYYKCRDSIFTFSHAPLMISHSMATYSRNDRAANLVYSKLQDSDYLLSLFTTWRVSIEYMSNKKKHRPFEALQRYKHGIDIVIKAERIFLRDNDFKNLPFVPNSSGDYCDSKAMKKYYKTDDITFQMNSTSDFASESDITDSKSFHRSKRGVGKYGRTDIASKKEVIENRNLNYSSNLSFSSHQRLPSDEMPILNITGTNGHSGTRVCSSFQYNLNDCLALLSLIVNRITDSKQPYSYLQDCEVNYSQVRQCSLEIIRKFEESLQMLSENFEEEYSFDPVFLMEKLEQDIINNEGQNVNEILLHAVSPRRDPKRETFFQRLWNKLAKIY